MGKSQILIAGLCVCTYLEKISSLKYWAKEINNTPNWYRDYFNVKISELQKLQKEI